MGIKDQSNSGLGTYVAKPREPTNANFNVLSSGLTDISDLKGVLYGSKWLGTNIYYSFPNSANDYGLSYEAPEQLNNIRSLTTEQKNVIKFALNEVSEITLLSFIEVSPSSHNSPQLRFANSDYPPSAYSFYPDPSDAGGDTFYGPYVESTPNKGSYSWHTIIHELGHQLGLKHGHEESSVYGATGQGLSAEHDSQDYSIMTYHTSLGSDLFFRIKDGEAPTSFMMSDIIALQYMYGANYKARAGNTTYKWSLASNDTTIIENGVTSIRTGGYLGNKIITTIWDGGGNDTYDFGGYAESTIINLNPGRYSVSSVAQLADLNENILSNEALGNIYNAYLYNGNNQSLIENAIGGSGADQITGNIANNTLLGNFGDDIIYGLAGNDIIEGGAGNDSLIGGLGLDKMNGGEASDIYYFETAQDFASGEIIADTGLTGLDEIRFGVITASTLRLPSSVKGVEKIIIGTGLSTSAITTGIVANNINASAVSYGLQIVGNDGANILSGTAFNDILNGGAGRDTLIDGKGSDVMIGGPGADLFQISGTSSITDFGNDADVIQIARGGSANISLTSAWIATSSTTNAGVANISSNGLNINLSAVTGGSNGYNIINTGGAATLIGSRFNDIITGSIGDDIISGGIGKDIMNGLGGKNSFIYNFITESSVGANSDVIIGFDHATDLINLSGIDAKQQSGFLGNQAFSFSNSASANSIWWLRSNADTIIYADVNGAINGTVTADFSITLQGFSANSLTASDFVA